LIIRRQINDRAKIFQKNPQKILGEWI
jgi:hypothetical protein